MCSPLPHHLARLLACLLTLFTGRLLAAEKAGAANLTLTFRVEGSECAACFYSVHESVRQVPGVKEITDANGLGSRVRVTFDPRQAGAHRIAHAVWRALPLHSEPYRAALALRVPDYAKAGNAAKVDAVLERWKPWLEVESLDRDTGLFLLRFRPLPKEKRKEPLAGWRPDPMLRQIRAPRPEGLGLAASLADTD